MELKLLIEMTEDGAMLGTDREAFRNGGIGGAADVDAEDEAEERWVCMRP